MSTELRESIIVGIELILFSIVLFIIFIFAQYSREALVVKGIQNQTMSDIAEYREMYVYTTGAEIDIDVLKKNYGVQRNVSKTYNNLTESKAKEISNGNYVTGDDIVKFVGQYHSEYDVVIYKKNGQQKAITKDLNITSWDVSYVSDFLNEDIVKEYYCFAVYDSYYYRYDSIVFVEKSA